ncbi:MAG TPA: S8 family serine peptidase [Vicinamibacterales bacterium]|nr:S8 family serine peptidase [Vicinamibacterales bacterium]
MFMRFLGLCFVIAAAGLTAGAQQPNPSQPGTKRRIHDIPTRGMLSGTLRSESAPRPRIDTTGRSLELPSVWATDPANGAQYRRGQVLVKFRANTNIAARTRALQSAGGRITRTLPVGWNLVELTDADTAQGLRALRGRPEVLSVSFNYRRRAHQVRPNDEFFGLQWNFDAINMPLAWQINPGGRNDVIVAVIDSGLNTVTDTIVFTSPIVQQVPMRFAEVPDLVAPGRIASPRDFIYNDDLPVDLDGHGTHVAGTVGQQTNNNIGLAGVAYSVRLMPLKVLPGDWDLIFADDPGGTDDIIADAIRYAADNGAKVINLSLGGPGEGPILRDALQYALERGTFAAIAAGNSGDEGNPEDYPAAYARELRGVMAVGAVTRDLRHASYSSFHPYVEICAPGGESLVPFDFERAVTQVGYDPGATLEFLDVFEKASALIMGLRPQFDQFEAVPLHGTSMATPHVSGVAALLSSQGISSPGAIEEAIRRFAQPINATANQCGTGLVDARRALRGLGLAR